MRKLLSWVAVVALIGVGKIFAGPFGLEMGMTMEQLEPYIVEKGDSSITVNPPKPNDSFAQYVVKVHPQYGVYSIMAIGKPIQIEPDESSLRRKFKEIVDVIAKKYGKYSLSDVPLKVTLSSAISAMWDKQSGATLPDDLSQIFVTIAPWGVDAGLIIVSYHSKDYDKIEAEKKAAQDDVF